jgi:hypothetical protein
MSKAKAFKISIPEPCNEGWSNMSPRKEGRFCSSCEKTVVDFTKMTDNEIVKMITKSKQEEVKICGHFRKAQVNRRMMESVPYKSRPSGFMIAAALLTGLSFLSCQAQEEEHHKVGKVEMLKGDVAMEEVVNDKVQQIHVISEFSRESLSDVRLEVISKGYEGKEFVTDSLGLIHIDRIGDARELEIRLTHSFYETKILKFTFGHTNLVIAVMQDAVLIDGMVEGEMEIVPEEEPEK